MSKCYSHSFDFFKVSFIDLIVNSYRLNDASNEPFQLISNSLSANLHGNGSYRISIWLFMRYWYLSYWVLDYAILSESYVLVQSVFKHAWATRCLVLWSVSQRVWGSKCYGGSACTDNVGRINYNYHNFLSLTILSTSISEFSALKVITGV